MKLHLDPDALNLALALHLSPVTIPYPPEARPAAVLVPVLLDGGPPRTLLQVRSRELRDHAGELSFPGGKPEPGDADLLATALREAHEELALPLDRVEPLGGMRSVPVITGKYLLHPFVALVRGTPAMRPSPELERLIELPLAPWIEGEWPIHGTVGTWRGATFATPFFRLEGGEVLYGASAVIFCELLDRIATACGRALPPLTMVEERPWGERYLGQVR
jgi:8-oxo-dGTP pyrophosphatase MutT (NUDIX family)